MSRSIRNQCNSIVQHHYSIPQSFMNIKICYSHRGLYKEERNSYFKRNYEAHDRILRNCKAGVKKIRNFEAEIDGKLRNF